VAAALACILCGGSATALDTRPSRPATHESSYRETQTAHGEKGGGNPAGENGGGNPQGGNGGGNADTGNSVGGPPQPSKTPQTRGGGVMDSRFTRIDVAGNPPVDQTGNRVRLDREVYPRSYPVEYLLVAGAALLLAFSIFSLLQSAAFQAWATHDQKASPDPNAGVALAIGASAVAAILWLILDFLSSLRLNPIPYFLVLRPRHLAVAALIAALLPSTIGIFKFLLTAAFLRRYSPDDGSRSVGVPVVGAIASAISFAGSVASLLSLLREMS